jgi:predicted PurR-regulated permease PerM
MVSDGTDDPSAAGGTQGPTAGPPEPAEVIRVTLDVRSAAAIVVGLLGLLVVFALGRTTSRALTLIAIGVLLAFALEPLVKGAQRRLHCSRALAAALVGGLVLIAFGALVLVVGPPAIRQAERFGEELPETVRDLYDLPLVGGRLREAGAADKIQDWVRGLPGQLDAERVGEATESVVTGLTTASTVLLIAFVVLLDGEVLVRRLRQVVPLRYRDQADRAGRVFYAVVGTYFAGSLFVAFLAGIYVLTLGLVLGVPLAPVAAVWYAVVSLIPQVGGFLGVSFFTVLALSQGLLIGLIGLILIVAYMNAENYFISPAIVGRSVNLSPPTTMLAALVGGAALGVPGALAATPLCGTVKALYLEYRFGHLLDDEDTTALDRLKQLGPVRALRRRLGRDSS